MTVKTDRSPHRSAPQADGPPPPRATMRDRLARLIRPGFDPARITPRMRRDAGLSHRGLDRRAAARAPLIR